MRRPFAFGYFHICKCSLKWRIFRAAGIKTKLYFIICFIYMANSHLIEIDSIFRTLNTKIVQAPTESIPDGLDFCIYSGCRPIWISIISYDTSQMLKFFVFIFNRPFKPVFAVEVHDNTALIKTHFAFKFSLNNKRKEFFRCFYLKHSFSRKFPSCFFKYETATKM